MARGVNPTLMDGPPLDWWRSEANVPLGFDQHMAELLGSTLPFFFTKGEMDRETRAWTEALITGNVPIERLKELFELFEKFALELCESPIEQRMLAILLCCDFGFARNSVTICPPGDGHARNRALKNHVAVIVPQSEVGNYRADFLVHFTPRLFAHGGAIAIECDGKAFHAATEAQKERDKKRDEAFAALGIQTLRFGGSVIHGAPLSVMATVSKNCAALLLAERDRP